MEKKGALTLRYVVLFALAVMVLIVIILIFSGGVRDFVDAIKEIFRDIISAKPKDFLK